VVVGEESLLLRDDVVLQDLNWFHSPPAPGELVRVQLRHRAPDVVAEVTARSADSIALRLAEPRRAITPGQSGAVYRGDELIGGGRIR
jgi:tRNA-specific 2-thiouridylase